MEKDQLRSTREIVEMAATHYGIELTKTKGESIRKKISNLLRKDAKLPDAKRRYPSYEPAKEGKKQRSIRITQNDAERVIFDLASFCIPRSSVYEPKKDAFIRDNLAWYDDDLYEYLERESQGYTFTCEYEVLTKCDKTPKGFKDPFQMMAERLIEDEYEKRFKERFDYERYRRDCMEYYKSCYELDGHNGGYPPHPEDEVSRLLIMKLDDVSERLADVTAYSKKVKD